MTEEEKKLQKTTTSTTTTTPVTTATTTPAVDTYKSPYEDQIKGLYDKIVNRDNFEFSYNPSDDEMYNMYVNKYMQYGKQAMKDTMGQAAALTGGYGNSYAQGVGQRAYDQYLEQANSKLMEFSQLAYDRARQQYDDEGNRLQLDYTLTQSLADDDYAKYQDRLAVQAQNYENLAALITAAGYMPSPDELANANMSENAAKALQYQWAATYPQLAFNKGAITAEEYNAITGGWPIGYSAPGSGGNAWESWIYDPTLGAGYANSSLGDDPEPTSTSATRGEVARNAEAAYTSGAISTKEYYDILDDIRILR